jgi:hypothetical protein
MHIIYAISTQCTLFARSLHVLDTFKPSQGTVVDLEFEAYDRPTRSTRRQAPHAIDERLRYIRSRFRDKPFGGISLVQEFLLMNLLLPIYRCISLC